MSIMSTSVLTVYVFANALMMSCDVAITRLAKDGIYIAKSEGNKAMISAVLSALVAFIHTL